MHTVEAYMIEPARGVTLSSGIALTTVVLLRITSDAGEHCYVLSPTDAGHMSGLLLSAAIEARKDSPIA
jgi:hypothetical protein